MVKNFLTNARFSPIDVHREFASKISDANEMYQNTILNRQSNPEQFEQRAPQPLLFCYVETMTAVKKAPARKTGVRKTCRAKPVVHSVTVAKPGTRPPRVTAATALATLLAIMQDSDKDAIRVSAAKAILARLTAREEQTMRQRQTKKPTAIKTPAATSQAALDAIARLLDELAAAKSAGAAGAAAVDQAGAACATDPVAAELAHLAGARGARLG